MTSPASLRRRKPAVSTHPTRRAVTVPLLMTALSVAVFAALSATGDRAIAAPIGAGGPFVDLHYRLAPVLMKAACLLAAASGGVGTLSGLAAVRQGWRPSPGAVLAGCAAVAVLFAFVSPAASVDVQNYAEYGRIVVIGHSPWVMTPQQLYQLHDPVGLFRPPEWRTQPTVYGPAATALEAAAAWLGGTSMAWITFWIKVINAACYVAVAVVLDRLAGPDPERRARVGVLWAVNPLMLFWMVAGAHTDLLAVLPLVLALMAGRALRRREGDGHAALTAALTGALAGLAVAVKVTFAGPVAGLAAGVWQAATGRRRIASLAAGIAGGTAVLAGGYAVAGRAALHSLSQRLSSAHDSFLPLPASVYHHPALYAVVLLAAFLIVGGVLTWRMPPGPADAPELRPMLICALAVVIGGIVQYPWYDAMFFPLLALLPASRLDAWLVGRTALISMLVLPGVGISTFQYREARVAVPVFTACFLIFAALGGLRTARAARAASPRPQWQGLRRLPNDWLSFSKMGAAASRVARSEGVSSCIRCASHASRRRRTSCTRSLPCWVTVRMTCLRSVGWAARRTSPRSSRTAMTRVIDGGWTFSCSASSPGVIAPCRSRAASAASWMSDKMASVPPRPRRSTRSRRASLVIEIRIAVARPASVCIPASGIHQVHHAWPPRINIRARPVTRHRLSGRRSRPSPANSPFPIFPMRYKGFTRAVSRCARAHFRDHSKR